jgi:hypothetical protein
MERVLAAARPATDDAWTLSTGADLALPEVHGRRPLAVRAISRYMRRLHAAAEHDPVAAAAFVTVVMMHERPSHLLRPALRVMGGDGGRGAPSGGLNRGLRVRDLDGIRRGVLPP